MMLIENIDGFELNNNLIKEKWVKLDAFFQSKVKVVLAENAFLIFFKCLNFLIDLNFKS